MVKTGNVRWCLVSMMLIFSRETNEYTRPRHYICASSPLYSIDSLKMNRPVLFSDCSAHMVGKELSLPWPAYTESKRKVFRTRESCSQ